MKILREKEEFKPVTVTLETQEELTIFYALFKGFYYFPDLLKMVTLNLCKERQVYTFLDKFLPALESILNSNEKR